MFRMTRSKYGYITIEDGEDARIKEIRITQTGRTFIQNLMIEDGASPKLRLLSILETIPKEDIDKFIEVGSILCSELVGEKYMEWTLKTTNILMEESHSRN